MSDEPARSYTVPICPDPTLHGVPAPSVEEYVRIVLRPVDAEVRAIVAHGHCEGECDSDWRRLRELLVVRFVP